MKTGKVGIIGRPNVGKSTLFNYLTRSRKAVVKDVPGVTRDILIEPTNWWGHDFDVVDTGGITECQEGFSPIIKKHVLSYLENLDLLIVVMDGRSGLLPEDRDIIKIAKEANKPLYLVVNKVDQAPDADLIMSEFYEFGIPVHSASFEKRDNVDGLIEWVITNLKEKKSTEREGIKIAILGKPNVGKSSLCNFLLGQDRMLVSPIAGTTVDSVEDEFSFNGKDYILVDTAGLRRASKRTEGIEILSAYKSKEAIRHADLVLLMVDSLEGPTVQDAKMAELILEKNKAVILVANKTDIAKKEKPEFRKKFRADTQSQFHFFRDIPLCFISAKTGNGVEKMFDLVNEIWDKLNIDIKTSKLNDFFYKAIRSAPSPVYGTQNVKFYYLTQTGQRPPSFITFANHPKGVTPSYRRFLVNQIKEHFNLYGIPIRIFIMKKTKGSNKSAAYKQAAVEQEHTASL
ncbi:ribosome biogenesis GTPase Der [bacterium]|nr:ribosome biogenesis GTPase Der [bacterium]